MSKTLLGVVCSAPMPVNMVGNFVNENVIKIKVTDGITVVMAKLKRMSAKKNTLPPIYPVTAEGTVPRSLLLSSASEKKYSAKSDKMLGGHEA